MGTEVAVNMGGESSMANAAAEAQTAPEVAAAEAPPAEPTPPAMTEQEKKYHEAFAKLTRREREIQRQAQEFKAEKHRIEQEIKELNEYKSLREKAKLDPLALTRHFGLDYKQLTNQILNDDKPTTDTEISYLKEQVEKLRAEKQLEVQRAEQEKAEKTISSFKSDMVSYLESQGDKYELIKTFNAYDQVMNSVYEHWKETGEYLKVDEVADELENQMELEARKLLGLKKLTPKQEAQVAEALEAKDQAPVEPPKSFEPPKTLTNRMVAAAVPAKSGALLSEEESKAAAAKLLKWT